MKFEITKDLLEEIIQCIIDNDLNADKATKYTIDTIYGSVEIIEVEK